MKKMDNLIIETIADAVKNRLGDGYLVRIRTVNGINQQKRTGITITGPDRRMTPMIYLDKYIPVYLFGAPLEDIADEVIKTYREYMVEEFDIVSFLDFESVKDRIIFQLINTSKNKDYLKNVPHINFFDLSLIFRVVVNSHAGDSIASTVIQNSHLKMWNVTTDEIFALAKENSPHLLPCEIQKINDVIAVELPEYLENDENSEEPDMYVITNHMCQNGSGCILYPSVLSDFASAIGNFYMMPSSIHQFILVPEDSGMSPKDLLNMVQSVNHDELPTEDFLSDNIYFYNKKTNQITQITEVSI